MSHLAGWKIPRSVLVAKSADAKDLKSFGGRSGDGSALSPIWRCFPKSGSGIGRSSGKMKVPLRRT